ncbi:hypothetical protein THTE_0045 [Thermogutta terrifontis]|uniref:Uncharacterized protein n=1 Tax=Thermogutta terrifontis TaxID=1331910 RepID=A0A286R9L2_9BACT|nr:hypothetical protein THTE_0045 [Thermogutta terrifontis]
MVGRKPLSSPVWPTLTSGQEVASFPLFGWHGPNVSVEAIHELPVPVAWLAWNRVVDTWSAGL